MNCSYCDAELISDQENYYGDVLICNGNMGLAHHYEKADDG